MMRKDMAVTTGDLGEQMVVEHFAPAKRTGNWYDAKKDGILGKMTYEVKTFRLNYKDQGFWIPENQFKKLDNVDMVFFVKIPETEDEGATIYLSINHKDPSAYKSFEWKGRTMRSYHLNRCLPITNINDDRAYEMMCNSVQMSTHKRFSQKTVYSA